MERADDGSRIQLVAERDLDRAWRRVVHAVGAWVEIDPATVPDDAEYLGFAFTQFALPVIARAGLRLRLPSGPQPALTARR